MVMDMIRCRFRQKLPRTRARSVLEDYAARCIYNGDKNYIPSFSVGGSLLLYYGNAFLRVHMFVSTRSICAVVSPHNVLLGWSAGASYIMCRSKRLWQLKNTMQNVMK